MSIFLRFLTFFVNILEDNYGAKLFGRFLTINENCIDCGKCIKNCPTGNIYKKAIK